MTSITKIDLDVATLEQAAETTEVLRGRLMNLFNRLNNYEISNDLPVAIDNLIDQIASSIRAAKRSIDI